MTPTRAALSSFCLCPDLPLHTEPTPLSNLTWGPLELGPRPPWPHFCLSLLPLICSHGRDLWVSSFLKHAMLFHASVPLHISPESGTPSLLGPPGPHPLRLSSPAITTSPRSHTHRALYLQLRAPAHQAQSPVPERYSGTLVELI